MDLLAAQSAAAQARGVVGHRAVDHGRRRAIVEDTAAAPIQKLGCVILALVERLVLVDDAAAADGQLRLEEGLGGDAGARRDRHVAETKAFVVDTAAQRGLIVLDQAVIHHHLGIEGIQAAALGGGRIAQHLGAIFQVHRGPVVVGARAGRHALVLGRIR